jgi:hypothetical protein
MGWIETVGGFSQWKLSVLARAAKGNIPGHNKGGRRGILVNETIFHQEPFLNKMQLSYPDIVKAITSQLVDLRAAGAPLSLATVRCIIIAIIREKAPEIFEHRFKDGSTFQVSDSFCRKFLDKTMAWSMRKGTKAAQKLPADAEEKCGTAFLRRAWTIKEHRIPAELIINADQTGVVYLPGSRMTWAPRGSKQVGVIGNEEKRAFTALLAVSAAGDRLPTQCIYEGKTECSMPTEFATSRRECDQAKFHFVFSRKPGNHWLNQKNNEEVGGRSAHPVPGFTARSTWPASYPEALLIIDVWSVHRSAEFLNWMRETHPEILIDFVPGGGTGIGQPLDVGLNRPFKHAVKVAYHSWLVDTLIKQQRAGETLDLDTTLPVLRDASVGWLWEGYNVIQDKELILKVSVSHQKEVSLTRV